MTANETTSLTLRLPQTLRDRLKRAAKADHRTESQFVRMHLDALLVKKSSRKTKPAA